MKTGTRVRGTTSWKKMQLLGKCLLLCGAAGILGGCAERKAHAFPWATVILVRPNPPAGHSASAAELADIAPDFRVEPPNLAKILPSRPGPLSPRPRTQNGNTSETTNGTNGSKAPLLAPELSAVEIAEAKGQYLESVAATERNLGAAKGKSLTPGQLDAISKINRFLSEAREASGEGDWVRARNLAKKAQILSQDLIGST